MILSKEILFQNSVGIWEVFLSLDFGELCGGGARYVVSARSLFSSLIGELMMWRMPLQGKECFGYTFLLMFRILVYV